MVSDEAKRIILGTWLSGSHLEDIGLISDHEFGKYAPLAAQIRQGNKGPMSLMDTTGLPIEEISRIISDAQYSNMYEDCVGSILQERFRCWLQENPGATVWEVLQKAKEHTREQPVELPRSRTLTDISADYLGELDKRKENTMLPTGIEPLDETIGGITPGRLVVVGARPGTGKSALLLQVAVNAAKADGKVLFFPLEMTATENVERMVMRYANGIPQESLRSGGLTEEQWDEVNRVFTKFESLNERLMMFEMVNSIEAIEDLIREHKPDIVAIDQMTQVRSADQSFNSIRERYTYLTAELKRMTLEHDTSIWLAAQMNRGSESNDGFSLDSLKESGSLEEDADVVLLLRDISEGGSSTYKRVLARVAKHRQGPLRQFELGFNPQRFKFDSS